MGHFARLCARGIRRHALAPGKHRTHLYAVLHCERATCLIAAAFTNQHVCMESCDASMAIIMRQTTICNALVLFPTTILYIVQYTVIHLSNVMTVHNISKICFNQLPDQKQFSLNIYIFVRYMYMIKQSAPCTATHCRAQACGPTTGCSIYSPDFC